MLHKIKSALSTVRETLQAVRELPGAIREVVEFARESGAVCEIALIKSELELSREASAQILRELGWRSPEFPKPGAIRLEIDKLFDELAVEKYVWRMQWDWAKERITELTAKLARYEAAETWHQVTAGEGELPPEGVDVICRLAPESPPYIGKYYPGYEAFEWRFLSSGDVPC